MKMLTYCHICCAFYFHPSLISERIANFCGFEKPLDFPAAFFISPGLPYSFFWKVAAPAVNI
jgi:hypothetical protein